MLATTKFPQFVTHASGQSRDLGERLDDLLGNRTPSEIISNEAVLIEVAVELWHNLPCLTNDSVLHCLPIYIALQKKNSDFYLSRPKLPASWQLRDDLADRLECIFVQEHELAPILMLMSKEERAELLAFCDVLESEGEDYYVSLEPLKSYLHSLENN